MEKFYGKSFERSFESQEIIEKAYLKAEKILEEESIKIENFSDLYGEENVARDREYVSKMETIFEKESSPEKKYFKKMAEVFEAIIHDQAESNEWLGQDATTIKPSRYDDIKNGVDTIVKLQEGEGSASHLALAIDATFNEDVTKKFDRIKREIEKGELAKVKYFSSEYITEYTNIGRGEMVNIPRIVIGADRSTIRDLSELWLEKNNKALANHLIQFQILEEMLAQFGTFKDYAQKVNQPKIATIYNKTEKIIKEIYAKKKKSIKITDAKYDSVFESIKDYLKNFD